MLPRTLSKRDQYIRTSIHYLPHAHMKISIITINFNNTEGLQRTILSVRNQTCSDYEYIVIDGGSNDGSVDIIKQNTDIINFWVSEKDKGIYHAMNKGIQKAQGEYCIFMNAGDTFYNHQVIEQVTQHHMVEDVVCGDLCMGKDIICPNPDQVTLRSLYKKTIFHQASFIKTTLLKNKPYDETLRSASDWKWFLHTLIFENKTYNHLPIIIARFEGGGFSEKESEVGQNEVIQELQHMLPERIRQDYEDYCFGTSPYRKMMNQVESVPKLKKLIYQIDIKVLKLLNIIIKANWIKEL